MIIIMVFYVRVLVYGWFWKVYFFILGRGYLFGGGFVFSFRSVFCVFVILLFICVCFVKVFCSFSLILGIDVICFWCYFRCWVCFRVALAICCFGRSRGVSWFRKVANFLFGCSFGWTASWVRAFCSCKGSSKG